MVFLPKKSSGNHEGVDFYEPANTRPLSIVNCDNRLMASAMRLRIEPILQTVVSSDQQGFLCGRSLLKNIIDIDDQMRAAALAGGFPAAIFFDFAAAFPSISQDFLFTTLRDIGLPRETVQFIKNLYFENKCLIAMGGEKFEGFCVTAGIRQGCPLSPLLFAVVADLLLRRLKNKFPNSMRRAYADDLAMVLPDVLKEGGHILDCFNDYHRVSGLKLNMGKVVIVPLWRPDPRTYVGRYRQGPSFIGPFNSNAAIIKNAIIQLFPGWGPAIVTSKAKYLGFTIGPEAGDDTWTDTYNKTLKRVDAWQRVGCSLFYTITLYNVYILSTFSFICQLINPPGEWEKQEALLLRRLIKGPWMWAGPEIFKELKNSLHFPREAGDLRSIAKAAQFRVACNEFKAEGGLLIQNRVACTEAQKRSSKSIHLYNHWGNWLDGGFSAQLLENYKMLGEAPHRINQLNIESTLSKDPPPDHGT